MYSIYEKNPVLTSNAKELLEKGDLVTFNLLYGDYYVQGVYWGAYITVTKKVAKGSESWSAASNNEISMNGGIGKINGNGVGSLDGNVKNSKSNENTSLLVITEGLDHNEKADIPESTDEAVDAYLKSINSKTKKGGKELYFSLVSYNTHTEIMVILSKV